MEHLLGAWPMIRESIGQRHVLLIFDFDGTLAPIVNRPSAAMLSAETRSLLRRLNEKEWCSIAIISGRTLGSLARKVQIESLIYGGSHGARLSGPGIDFQAPLPETARTMKVIASRLGRLHSSVKGVIIENKGESIAVHYRNVEEEKVPLLIETVNSAAEPFVATHMVRVREGKKVFDIVPYTWDKGKAVLWLLDHVRASLPRVQQVFPIYIGDDTTDEDAFAALKGMGLTVLVGLRQQTEAVYYLKDISEIRRFMIYLLVDGRSCGTRKSSTGGQNSRQNPLTIVR